MNYFWNFWRVVFEESGMGTRPKTTSKQRYVRRLICREVRIEMERLKTVDLHKAEELLIISGLAARDTLWFCRGWNLRIYKDFSLPILGGDSYIRMQ